MPAGGRHQCITASFPTLPLTASGESAGTETTSGLPPLGCQRAGHHVDELLIVDPQERRAHWLGLQPDRPYRPVEVSRAVALGPDELVHRIDWPR